MRNKTEILETIISLVINYQNKYHKPVRKIVIPVSTYNELLYELQEEGLKTIYGTELRASTRIKKIVLA